MTRGIIAGLFTPEQARHHLQLIREHLLFPDGVRLMDRPVRYRGGPQQLFRRAESAAFFGREIGLMYVHAHLGYGEALAVLGEADALWEALLVVNPIAVTDRLANGSLRQRNAYFSSSDAAFSDRYQAEREWERRQGWAHSRRRRLAHLFQRPRPLRQRAASPGARTAPVFWSAQRDTAASMCWGRHALDISVLERRDFRGD